MRAALMILAILGAMLLSSCGAAASEPRAQLAVAEALGEPAGQGFARATTPRPFSFPADHGPHREYAAEWWYYTGNLTSSDGRQYGFQLTFFRFGLAADAPLRESAWAANEIYMAHFALSDIAAGKFYAFERFSRGAAGLAGAQAEPFRVWLEDWSSDGLGPTGTPMRIRAAQDGVALDLTLEAGKPIVLQGDQGLSQKSGEPGNASYYYSMTRMPTNGTIETPDAAAVAVQGHAWMDREWSTSALGPDQVGWDWFALQLGDGREIMFYQLRLRNGQSDPYSKGILVQADGSTTLLKRDDVELIVTNTWQSPRGTTYPAAWNLRIPSQSIDLQISPLLANQELPLSVTYWEGAVQISGTSTGRGYVELTGYADSGS